jgi:hypothetical protein
VASFDAGSGTISLAWWPVEDLLARKEAAAQAAEGAEDGVLQEDPAFAHPYDEGGNLEVSRRATSTLVQPWEMSAFRQYLWWNTRPCKLLKLGRMAWCMRSPSLFTKRWT